MSHFSPYQINQVYENLVSAFVFRIVLFWFAHLTLFYASYSRLVWIPFFLRLTNFVWIHLAAVDNNHC